MKKFMKKTEGFTLVELIVVIAILGILAGVGTVGYSGYVTKANQAADQQLASSVKNALELARYADTDFPASGCVVLSMDNAPSFGGNTVIQAALQRVFGNDLSGLKLKHKGWGNGVAVTQAMLNTLTNTSDTKLADMNTYLNTNIYGDAKNLSFTNKMPELMTEIRNIADGMSAGSSDEDTIDLMNAAAAMTSNASLAEIQNLWISAIEYRDGKYVGAETILTSGSDLEKKATVAAVVRARNTCMALSAIEENPELAPYYTVLTQMSTGNAPLDLNTVPGNATLLAQLQSGMVAANPDASSAEIEEHINTMGAFLTKYNQQLKAPNGVYVADNDAAAYYAMMQTIKGIDDSDQVDETNLDKYFNSVTGSVDMFQAMVEGKTTLTELQSGMAGAVAGEDTVALTIAGDKIIVSPTAVLGQ